ncbi:hypothetical protein F4860DRAFT_529140 [Xylaria cubensis]|nr:hypothetical protein F4860DRAFT_529140 [Xylaria cubensis]
MRKRTGESKSHEPRQEEDREDPLHLGYDRGRAPTPGRYKRRKFKTPSPIRTQSDILVPATPCHSRPREKSTSSRKTTSNEATTAREQACTSGITHLAVQGGVIGNNRARGRSCSRFHDRSFRQRNPPNLTKHQSTTALDVATESSTRRCRSRARSRVTFSSHLGSGSEADSEQSIDDTALFGNDPASDSDASQISEPSLSIKHAKKLHTRPPMINSLDLAYGTCHDRFLRIQAGIEFPLQDYAEWDKMEAEMVYHKELEAQHKTLRDDLKKLHSSVESCVRRMADHERQHDRKIQRPTSTSHDVMDRLVHIWTKMLQNPDNIDFISHASLDSIHTTISNVIGVRRSSTSSYVVPSTPDSRHDHLIGHNNEVASEFKQLRHDLAQSKAELKKTKTQLEKSKNKETILCSQAKSHQETLTEHKAEINTLKESLNTANDNVSRLNAELIDRHDDKWEVKKLQAQIEELNRSLVEKESNAVEQKNQHDQEIERLRSEWQGSMQTMITASEKEAVMQLRLLEITLSAERMKTEKTEKSNSCLTQICAQHQRNISYAQNENRDLQSALDLAQQQEKSLKESYDKLKPSLGLKDEEIKKLGDCLVRWKKAAGRHLKKAEQFEELYAEASEHRDIYCRLHKESREEAESLTSSLANAQEEIRLEGDQKDKLMVDLAKTREKFDTQSNGYAKLYNLSVTQKKEVTTLQERLKSIRETVVTFWDAPIVVQQETAELAVEALIRAFKIAEERHNNHVGVLERRLLEHEASLKASHKKELEKHASELEASLKASHDKELAELEASLKDSHSKELEKHSSELEASLKDSHSKELEKHSSELEASLKDSHSKELEKHSSEIEASLKASHDKELAELEASLKDSHSKELEKHSSELEASLKESHSKELEKHCSELEASLKDSHSKELEKHCSELEASLKDSHSKELEKHCSELEASLKESHSKELAELEASLKDSHSKELEKQSTASERCFKIRYDEQLRKQSEKLRIMLHEAHKQELSDLKDNHLKELKTQHDKVESSLEATYKQNLKTRIGELEAGAEYKEQEWQQTLADELARAKTQFKKEHQQHCESLEASLRSSFNESTRKLEIECGERTRAAVVAALKEQKLSFESSRKNWDRERSETIDQITLWFSIAIAEAPKKTWMAFIRLISSSTKLPARFNPCPEHRTWTIEAPWIKDMQEPYPRAAPLWCKVARLYWLSCQKGGRRSRLVQILDLIVNIIDDIRRCPITECRLAGSIIHEITDGLLYDLSSDAQTLVMFALRELLLLFNTDKVQDMTTRLASSTHFIISRLEHSIQQHGRDDIEPIAKDLHMTTGTKSHRHHHLGIFSEVIQKSWVLVDYEQKSIYMFDEGLAMPPSVETGNEGMSVSVVSPHLSRWPHRTIHDIDNEFIYFWTRWIKHQ